MKFFKYLILLIVFYFLILLQKSFLIPYAWHKAVPNLALLVFIALLLTQKRELKQGLLLSIIAGLFLDVFSAYFFGLYILLFMALFFFVGAVRKYFEIDRSLSNLFILLFSVLLYYFLISLLNIGSGWQFNLFNIIYNFLVGILIYFIIKAGYVFYQKRFGK